jgi:hypothetical protein
MGRPPVRVPKAPSHPATRRTALEFLASCPEGCTEALTLANGFTVELMLGLVRAGLGDHNAGTPASSNSSASMPITPSARLSPPTWRRCVSASGTSTQSPRSADQRRCSHHDPGGRAGRPPCPCAGNRASFRRRRLSALWVMVMVMLLFLSRSRLKLEVRKRTAHSQWRRQPLGVLHARPHSAPMAREAVPARPVRRCRARSQEGRGYARALHHDAGAGRAAGRGGAARRERRAHAVNRPETIPVPTSPVPTPTRDAPACRSSTTRTPSRPANAPIAVTSK